MSFPKITIRYFPIEGAAEKVRSRVLPSILVNLVVDLFTLRHTGSQKAGSELRFPASVPQVAAKAFD